MFYLICIFFSILSSIIIYYFNSTKLIIKYPKHIGIVMDGNGRWAISKNLKRYFGHKAGATTLNNLMKNVLNYTEIKYITAYSLSSANLKRPKEELNFIYDLMEKFIDENIDFYIRSNIKITTIGDLSVLPESLIKKLNNFVDKTKDLTGLHIILAINYDSRSEIVRTFNKMLNDNIKDISWETINKYLDTAHLPDPDLIIRTSGEYRLSNFLMLQSANAELIFIDKYWPDFNNKDLEHCLFEFSKRQRRFGLTSEQVKKLT